MALGDLADLIWDPRPLQQAAQDWRSGRVEDGVLPVGEAVDGLLTQLGLLLWREQVDRWEALGLANTTPAQTNEAVKWYLTGQRAGDVPIFDGMCSRCGGLLHGALNQSGNKRNGPPQDAEGQPCPKLGQPPFLLRYSPKFLAEKAPAVFAWSEESNRLTLRAEHRAAPPWRIRRGTRTREAREKDWLYCAPCHESLFSPDPKPPIPLRDEASARGMRPDPKQQAREAEEEKEEEQEEQGAAGAAAPAVPAGARERAPAPPPETAAAAASYREKWDAALDRYARAPGGAFGMGNLVPAPRPELWQDAPQSPLSLLTSPQAQGRLSVCQLISGMEESQAHAGLATYASATGEMNFTRRSTPAGRRTIERATAGAARKERGGEGGEVEGGKEDADGKRDHDSEHKITLP